LTWPAGPQSGAGAVSHDKAPPAEVRRFYGDGFGTLACEDGQWGDVKGCLIDDACGEVGRFEGFMFENRSVGTLPPDRRWGRIRAKLTNQDNLRGIGRCVGYLDGNWELYSETQGIIWGSIRATGLAGSPEIGCFYGEFRMHGMESSQPAFDPRVADPRRNWLPANVGAPTSASSNPRQAREREGDEERQSNGCLRIYWEVWK
jgi:hypothetical protein